MSRFPDIPDTDLDRDQAEMAAKAQRSGPFPAFLRAPLLWQALQPLRRYLAEASSLEDQTREAVMLAVARELGSTAAFAAHAVLAERAGLDRAVVERIGTGELPSGLPPPTRIAIECSLSLLRRHVIDDALFASARSALGEQGLLDVIGLTGFFTTICLTLNAAQITGDAPFPSATASYSPSGQS